MPTFTPGALNAPQNIDYTATRKCIWQASVDMANMQAGDTLRAIMSHNKTGNMRAYEDESFSDVQTVPGLGTYIVLLDAGDTVRLTLGQTAGVPRSYDYDVTVSGG